MLVGLVTVMLIRPMNVRLPSLSYTDVLATVPTRLQLGPVVPGRDTISARAEPRSDDVQCVEEGGRDLQVAVHGARIAPR